MGFGTLKLRHLTELIKDLQEYSIQFWCPQPKNNMELMEQVQRRATKLLKGLEHLPNEDKLRKLGAFQPGEDKDM